MSRFSIAAITIYFSLCSIKWLLVRSPQPISPLPCGKFSRRQKNAKVLLAEAVHIDAANRRVILSDGTLPYDTLVVATGSTHQYFGHDEWEQFAPGLKTVEDATAMRRRILLAFEAAERESDPAKQKAWMTFVIVGGGPYRRGTCRARWVRLLTTRSRTIFAISIRRKRESSWSKERTALFLLTRPNFPKQHAKCSSNLESRYARAPWSQIFKPTP